jgi:hypothetical protein
MKGDRPGWMLRKRAGMASKEASIRGKFRILSLSLDLNSEPNVDRTGDGNYVWKIQPNQMRWTPQSWQPSSFIPGELDTVFPFNPFNLPYAMSYVP